VSSTPPPTTSFSCPRLLLALFGCALLLFDFWVFPQEKQRKWLLFFLVDGRNFRRRRLLAAADLSEHDGYALTAFKGTLVVDGFALYFNWMFLIGDTAGGADLLPLPRD
jgi:NADH-quinone oxidoreductase subunit N